MSNEQHLLNLNGPWRLYDATVADCPRYHDPHCEVTVPGEVHRQRTAAGRAPDPYVDCNYLGEIRREADHVWLARRFARPPWPGEPTWLVFEGIDCRSEVYLNGRRLGGYDGMYGGPAFDVTGLLGDENELMVHILPAESNPDLALEFWKRGQVFEDDIAPLHRYLKQPALAGGNGFPPRVVTAGIWLPVRLERRGPQDLADAWIQTCSLTDDGGAEIVIHLAAWTDGERDVECELADPTGRIVVSRRQRVRFTRGRAELPQRMAATRLWWPNGHGEAALYRLTAALPGGTAVSRWAGIRVVRWVRTPGTSKDLTLEVNGKRIYAGGTSWSTGDRTLQFDAERYRWILSLLCEAHTVFMRVWGGIPREPAFFYEMCDAMGLLVTQDFMLANYANQPATLARIDPGIYERQVRQLLRDLRGHTCLIGWFGGNELRADEVDDAAIAGLLDRAECAVRELDPDTQRLWLRSSYQLDHGWTDEYDHYGRRLAQTEKVAGILDGEPRFAIEYYPGSQHALVVQDVRQVARFIPAAVRTWPPPAWIHQRRINGAPWDQCFLPGTLPIDVDPVTAAPYGSWTELAYHTQAYALANIEAALGNWRARWPEHAGSVLWHALDQFPILSWGTVDYHGAPKGLYYGYKRGLAPVRAVMKYTRPQRDVRERLRGWVRVLNFSGRPLTGYRVEVRIYDEHLREVMAIGPEGTVVLAEAAQASGAGLGLIRRDGLLEGRLRLPRARTAGDPVPDHGVLEVFEFNSVGYLFPYHQLVGLSDACTDAEWGQRQEARPFAVLVTLRGCDGTLLSQTCYPFNFDWHDSPRVRSLARVPVAVRAGARAASSVAGEVTVRNDGTSLVPWLEVTSPDIVPDQIAWDDNFIALAPGEERRLAYRLRSPAEASAAPRFAVQGLNAVQAD